MSPARRSRDTDDTVSADGSDPAAASAVSAAVAPGMDASFEALIGTPGAFLTAVELVPWHGLADDPAGQKSLAFGAALADDPRIDALSVTDNAGGHAMASPEILAREIALRGGRPIVHIACRDRNRNELLSLGWRLASQGLRTVLTLSGDYPVEGYGGVARPVFDLDSVGLLEMYRREGLLGADRGLFPGVAVNPHKRFEWELMPQYQKLELKLRTGARFVIPQVGYDARKQDELLRWIRLRGFDVPVFANVYRLTRTVARIFNAGKIPGVTVTDSLLAIAEREGASPDKGKAFFLDLAARQVAIARGLGHAGAYLGGVHDPDDVGRILDIAAGFAPDDWRAFAREIHFGWADEFHVLEPDRETGLSSDRLSERYRRSTTPAARRRSRRRVDAGYRASRLVHDVAFTPGSTGFRAGARFFEAAERYRLARPLHVLEQAVKIPLFDCRDCGDCSLPDIAYLCPESHCAKNQRNGPCGGTHEGECEVPGRQCIWARAYRRLKPYGEEDAILHRPVVVTDNALRRTSAWANTYLGRDHAGRPSDAPDTGGH
jgi:methylenetetrahydrofolate reductase (NADPH)